MDGTHQLPNPTDVCWSRGWMRQDEMVETMMKRHNEKATTVLTSITF